MSRQTRSQDSWGRATRWTLIRTASGTTPDDEVRRAWEQLVERYKDPVKNAVRRLMRHHPSSEDVASDFFSYLYSHHLLDKAEPQMGRFRCFIQGVIKRYVKQEARKASSGMIDLSDRELPVPSQDEAEQREEAEWAISVLKNATRELVSAAPRDGELLLKAFGIAPYHFTSRRDLSKQYGLSKNALNVAIHRARQRLRQLIIEEIRDTVDSDTELAAESELIGQRLCAAKPELFAEEESFIEWADEEV